MVDSFGFDIIYLKSKGTIHCQICKDVRLALKKERNPNIINKRITSVPESDR